MAVYKTFNLIAFHLLTIQTFKDDNLSYEDELQNTKVYQALYWIC